MWLLDILNIVSLIKRHRSKWQTRSCEIMWLLEYHHRARYMRHWWKVTIGLANGFSSVHHKAIILTNDDFASNTPHEKYSYWPFVRGIHRSPVTSPHEGQWRGALMFSLLCVWINGWVNNREPGDLIRYRTHYDVTVMVYKHSTLRLRYAMSYRRLSWYS